MRQSLYQNKRGRRDKKWPEEAEQVPVEDQAGVAAEGGWAARAQALDQEDLASALTAGQRSLTK